jgi:hypothetical protein
MSFVGDLIGDVFGGITGAKQAGRAAERAGATQSAAAQQGIEEQRRQFDKFVELMAPYVTAGTGALGGQQALLGLGGAEAQQQAIAGIEGSPQFQAITQQGENALLQNAAATGGLRGGNVQGALAQFRPQILSDLINQQYARLGGMSAMGQNAAAGQAAAGQTLGSNVSNLFGQQGAATAGGQLAQGAVPGQTFGQLLQIGGAVAGAMGGFGGAPAGAPMGGGGAPNLGYMGGGQGLRPSGSIFG